MSFYISHSRCLFISFTIGGFIAIVDRQGAVRESPTFRVHFMRAPLAFCQKLMPADSDLGKCLFIYFSYHFYVFLCLFPTIFVFLSHSRTIFLSFYLIFVLFLCLLYLGETDMRHISTTSLTGIFR
jgi:hypothetical protein